MKKHVDLAGRMLKRLNKSRTSYTLVMRKHLDRFYHFDELLLRKCFQTAIDHGLVQLSLRLNMLCPYT
jgi:hypothetical protein